MLAKDIEVDKPNKLLTEIGQNLTEMLFDLLFFPEGPRLRDRVSHGEYHFDDVDSTIANYLICIGVCFCLKYLFPWRQKLKTRSKYLGELCFVMDSYRSHFHPISFLNREICLAIENIDMVVEIVTECHLHLNIDQDHNQCEEINKIVTIYMSIPVVKNIFQDNCEICFDKNLVKRYIKKIINEPRHFLHRPKKELEIIGLLRQIAKQCQTAVLQVCFPCFCYPVFILTLVTYLMAINLAKILYINGISDTLLTLDKPNNSDFPLQKKPLGVSVPCGDVQIVW